MREEGGGSCINNKIGVDGGVLGGCSGLQYMHQEWGWGVGSRGCTEYKPKNSLYYSL